VAKNKNNGLVQPGEVNPFFAPLKALQQLIHKFHDHGVIMGGIAASLLGKARLTADLDALVLLDLPDIPQFLEMAKKLGIIPRIRSVDEFARKNHVLLMQHVPSGMNIDIVLGLLPFEKKMVERGSLLPVSSLELRLPTPEDLIIMKTVAHRPKDMEDIKGIIEVQKHLDRRYIQKWSKEFATAMDSPEILTDLVDLLK
jgi:Nucleotidyltransferase of unknown function (DUF6036)